MFDKLKKFGDLFNKHQIDFFSDVHNKILQYFHYYFITKKDQQIDELNQRKIEKNIIVIDSIKDSENEYYIMCFSYTIILIKNSNFSHISSLLNNYQNGTIVDLTNNNINILFNKKNIIKNISYKETLDNFLLTNNYKINGWFKIFRCILVYFIENSLMHIDYDRLKDYFQKNRGLNSVDFEIDSNKYILIDFLANGSLSIIEMVYFVEKNEIIALKKFDIYSSECNKLFEREHNAYLNLKHPLIPKYYGYINNENKKGVFIEYIKGKTLDQLKEMKLSMEEKTKIIFEILILIEYLHNKHYIYRDLKPNNIFVNKNKSPILFDFDRLINIDESFSIEERTKNFSHIFCSPELIGNFSYEADIFSLGLLIYYIVLESFPKKISSSYVLQDFPENFNQLTTICKKCIDNDPKKRPKISELIDLFYINYFSKIPAQILELDKIQLINSMHNINFYEYWICIAENDNFFAQTNLALIYEEGKIISQDLEKSNHFYSQATQILIKKIKNKDLHGIYSKFKFLFIYENHMEKLNEIIEKFKFFTYYIYDFNSFDTNTNFKNIVVCCEGKFFIFNSIKIDLFLSRINKTKIIINANDNGISNEEINNFCKYYEKEGNENHFIQLTLRPISAYMIKRYFYPSYLFNDKSFFVFDKTTNDPLNKNSIFHAFISDGNYENLKDKIRELYSPIVIKQAKILSNSIKLQYNTFSASDFIELKQININDHGLYNLAYHIKSNHVFMIKKNNYTFSKEEFCQILSHDCLVNFYGFIENEDKIIGLVYEYLCNGSLTNYIISHKNDISQINSLALLIHIFRGINHIYNLPFQNINVSLENIYLDHNFTAYFLCSFSSVTNFDQDLEIKRKQSLINLFGEVIYLVFDKNEPNKTHLKVENCSKNLNNLYNLCINYKQGDDFSIDEIEKYILKEFDYDDFINYYILNENYEELPDNEIIKNDKASFQSIIDLIYEMIQLLVYMKRIELTAFLLLDFFSIAFIVYLRAKGDWIEMLYQIGISYENGFKNRKFYEKAKKFYEIASKRNHSKSLYHLGHLFENGFNVEKNYLEAKKYYELAGMNLYAIKHLALLYENGLGVVQNSNKAKEYFLLACNNFNSNTAFDIGEIFYNGIIVKKDISKAIFYYEIAAKKGNPNAHFKLGNIYENGNTECLISIDRKKAKIEYEKAGELLNSDVLFKIGNFYYYENNEFEHNHLKALEYYQKAAELGNPNAIFQLGIMYKEGYAITKDDEKANKQFMEYAKIQASILLNFGLFYENGYGVEKDYSKAKEFYELSMNLECPMAYFYLGLLYKNGLGVKQNMQKANLYFTKFSEKGIYDVKLIGRNFQDPNQHFITPEDYFKLFCLNNSNVLINLGKLYLKGYGLKKNCTLAKKLFQMSCEFNNPDGYYFLGRLYEKGCCDDINKIEQNYNISKNYFELAANNIKALYRLGIFYEKGLGVEQNYSKAIYYFELSASQKYMQSFYKLGKMYFNGNGVEVNTNKAKDYFETCIKMFNNLKSNYDKRNIFSYLSYNYLGLISISTNQINCIETVKNYFKHEGINICSYSQNNLGLIYQFFMNNLHEAKHFYKQAIKKNFAMSSYNLGYLYENQKKYDKALKYYINASNNENEPLILQNKKVEDEYLDISKTFIICLTNLKISHHYFCESKYALAEEYFMRVFSKLITNSYHFSVEINYKDDNYKDDNNIFSNLINFILNFPGFNFGNKIQKQDDKSNIPTISKDFSFEYAKLSPIIIENIKVDSNKIKCTIDPIENNIMDDPKSLFQLAMKNNKFKTMLINEIKYIIDELSKILYQSPFLILFGRMKSNTIL